MRVPRSKYRRWAGALAAGLGAMRSAVALGQLSAYPGAIGFGADATGGRTGNIVVVSNFNSSGAGSFAQAVETPNSIVVFNVGGYIDLKGEISVASNVTILGQTAPGGGIGLMDGELSFSSSSNDIVDYVRLRQGNGSSVDTGKAAIEMDNSSNIVLNHDSIQFGEWDTADINNCSNITIQNCLLTDAIGQQFGIHAQATSNFTIATSIFANNHNRNPFIENTGSVQMVNNVVYNVQAGFTSGSGGGSRQEDVVNNYFITGPSTTSNGDAAFFQVDSSDQMYQSGNDEDTSKDGTLNGSLVTASGVTKETSPWSSTTLSLPTLTAAQAVTYDTAQAGASIVRDQLDSLDISQVKSFGTSGGTTANGDYLYTSPSQSGLSNGGYGTIANGTPPTSTTGDGIPDTWAIAHGMNVSSAAQATALNPLGYTMIEAYANSLSEATLTTRTWNNSSGNWNTAGSWGGTLPGVYDIASVTGNGSGDGLVTVNSSSGSPAVFQLNIGGSGAATGEKVTVSSGALTVYDTITVGNLNTGTLEIDGGTVTANNVVIGNTLSGTTYNGLLTLNGGVLAARNIVLGGGSPGNWTTGGQMNWSGGTLQASGTLLVNVPVTLGTGGGIVNTSGNTGTISGVLSGSGSLTINGGGTLSLTGANTYTGVTTISGATLDIPTLVNAGAASELGASGNAAANLVLDGGTLAGVGGTDRLFTLTANGGTLDQSGGMSFSNSGAISLPQANVTLTLTGSNTGHESFSPALGDPGNGFVTSVLKTGAGKWTFNVTGDKTYSGLTNVSAGTLETLANNALSPDSTVNIAAGAFIEMHGYSSAINGLECAGTVQDSFGHSTDSFTIGANNGGGTFTGNLGNGDLPNVIKVGTGTQILGGTDTYTGTTTISGGILQFNTAASIGGTGVSVAIATGATAAAGYAMDQTTFLDRITSTSTGTAALAVSDANNLDFSSATGANLPNVSLGAVGTATYTGTMTPYGTTYRLGGGGGELILPNTNAATGVNNVYVSGAGTVDITGTNTYTGITTISGGAILDVAVLASGGSPSGIGQSSNSASNLILDGGTLAGAGSTDRLFTLAANGGTLDQSAGMIFTNTGAIALPQANVTLTLTGTNTGHETFSPSIADPGNGYVTSILKTGTGKWTFNTTGTKTYSGSTTITAGVLETLAGNALSPNSSISVYQGGDLDFHDYSQTINGLSGDGSVTNDFVAHNDTLTIGANNGGGTFTGTISSGATLNLVKTGTGTQILAGANAYSGNTTISGGTLKLCGNTPIASYNFSSISGSTVTNSGTAGSSMNATLNGSGGSLSTTGGPLPGTGMLTLTGNGSLDVQNPITDLSGTASWTVSLWVNTTEAGASLLSKGNGTTWTTGNSNFYLGVPGGGTGAGGVPDAVRYAGGWATGSSAVNTGTWQMVTFTDNNGTDAIYTNGVLNSTTLDGGFANADIGTMVRFGFTSDALDGEVNLNGSLSDINIYNTALTQAQIQSLYTTNVAGGNGSNILPSTSAVSLTSSSATLDIESVNQTIASLNGPAGSSVILGNGSVLTVSNATSTEFDGVISGNGSLIVAGGSGLTLGGASTYTGSTTVASGSLIVNGSLASTAINVSSGAMLNMNGSISSASVLTVSGLATLGPGTGTGILDRSLAGLVISSGGNAAVLNSANHSNRTLLITSALSIAGTTNAWQGQLDLGFNDAVIHGGSLASFTSEIKEGYNAGNWNGAEGIISSTAAANTAHLTALGVIQNTVDGTPTGALLYGSGTSAGLFDGYSGSLPSDVLVKYTFYGDANLDGKVDGSDYSRIDNGYLNSLTGWYNGDFNYDGVINGSDYTLIDNAFNTQGASLAAAVASPTAQIASSSSVPEPTALLVGSLASVALLGRRRKQLWHGRLTHGS